ncbi:tetraacyldisaccharide 4'-kinase [Halochromatium glycolicum]|uniref:Tetraacyldisaccharide 4'-kinase n=1 Tax=Halochromatium glycolicum TaxID=85075 RepID=A0AAJ0U6W1_9GAMM|nr:tetraacyldisaccharide 4'-kinase [Halochromatium glycolicum]
MPSSARKFSSLCRLGGHFDRACKDHGSASQRSTTGTQPPLNGDPLAQPQWRLRLEPERIWYQGHWLGPVLAPLAWLYCRIAALRRRAYQQGWLRSFSVSVPVIVVGNLTVGGTGKTPLVLWMAEYLSGRGYRPGIALRGYRAQRSVAEGPQQVAPDADPLRFGDEAVLLAKRSHCPVVAGRDRVAAAKVLADQCGCDLVLTDDGLQHYRLRRQLEILVLDGERRLGNGRCLPAGPLREPQERLATADLVVVNGDANDGHHISLAPGAAVNLQDSSLQRPLRSFADETLTAVAGIGHPQRFFRMLEDLGLSVRPIAYPDHHAFRASDLEHWPPGPVLMTEKDAVKCQRFARPEHWFVPVTAVPSATFVAALDRALAGIKRSDAAKPR